MSSPFTSLITKVLPVQSDPGQSITIRRLNPTQLRDASKVAQDEVMHTLKEMLSGLGDGNDAVMQSVVKALRSEKKADESPDQAVEPKETPARESTDVSKAKPDPLGPYDQLTLIKHGVIAWTYKELKPEPASYVEFDEESREWLAREILKLAKPALFEDAEALQKKDDGVLAVA